VRVRVLFAISSALLGCQPDGASRARSPGEAGEHDEAPVSSGRQDGSAADGGRHDERPAFCAREGADAVRGVFCGEEPVAVGGLMELERRLSIGIAPADAGGANYVGGYDSSGFMPVVFLAHSTALNGRLVSPINPRAIVIGGLTVLAFTRGAQQAEIVSLDRRKQALNFYLLDFEQVCNTAPGGCVPGDLYTPRVESGWTRVTVRDAEELKNTPSDCRQCHQRGRENATFLMRELEGPWTHFFQPDGGRPYEFPEPTGGDLVEDYVRAKGKEGYAGLSSDVIHQTIGLTLESIAIVPQPVVFDGAKILNERWPSDPNGYASRPVRSATWYAAYEAFKRGEQLALPYFEPRSTDAGKQARLTTAYRRYQAGEIAPEELPELSDIFPDDPQVRAEMGLQTEPGASPAQTLIQACGGCHNDVLDQSISRARFNIALGRMNRVELDRAIARLDAPQNAAEAMPPSGVRQLDSGGRVRLIDYLRNDHRPTEDDALLERAATLGMMGGAAPLSE
jgi:hypothetical protein